MILLFILIFIITFAMYQLPLEAVFYPILLCSVVGIIFLMVDYYKVYKKHLIMIKIKEFSSTMAEDLECFSTISDMDYQEIIQSLQKELLSLETTTSSRYQGMIDYYTVWVHQIKTPIASMRLNLQNEDTQFSRKLQNDLFRIEQYVEMVLAYLRLDSTTNDYVFKEYSVDNIIKNTIKKFSHEFIGRKILLEYAPINRTMVTDEKWFSFVLEQVLSNALKYTREGSVKIYLEDTNTLCIEDTGIGIAPEDLPRIFEKGYTGYNGRVDKKASGIGLYLCKKVCKKLGIRINIESEVGKGTIVKIDLDQYDLNLI